MKAKVNQETCIGCGMCTSICPDVFEYNDEGRAEAKVGEFDSSVEDTIVEAQQACPVDAIEIE